MGFKVLLVLFLLAGVVLLFPCKTRSIGKVILTLAAVISAPFLVLFTFIITAFSAGNNILLPICAVALCICAYILILGVIWGFIKNKKCYIPLISVFILSVGILGGVYGHRAYISSVPIVGEGMNVLYEYTPYEEYSKTATLEDEATLLLSENLPKMDGATALYPVYAAFAKAVYPKAVFYDENGYVENYHDNKYVTCTTTSNAYGKIVTGETDIIFVASPNKEQDQFARDSGIELVYTPIGREAFVFFVNSKNPIDNITIEDVQKIYSGEITHWSELGIDSLGKIRAFQREEGSGSQSTLQKLMAGKNLKEPEKEDVVDGMGGIISRTADYKNYKNAIGYSFRFYSTEMVKNNMIKLLKINGVEPTLENTGNGTYPLASEFYAVIRSDADENTKKLLEWIQGEQGQRIIEMTGYTPLVKWE